MNDQDKIFSYMKFTGPVLPAHVAKHISTNILLASAHLSDLASQGRIKISSLKIGGSPLYYLPEHKEKLQNYLHNLNIKDQEVVNKLKENRVLKDHDLDLLSRVSLRNMKDFAIQLTVNYHGEKEIFWKWYLLSDEHASEYIRTKLAPVTESPEIKPEVSEEQPGVEAPPQDPEEKNQPEEKTASKLGQLKQEKQEKQEQENPREEKPKGPTIPEEKREQKEEKKEEIQEKTEEDGESKTFEKKPLLQKIKDKLKPKKKEAADDLFSLLEAYFKERNIVIQSKETVRKNAEMNLLVEVPSVIGRLTYFCKAKSKKRCDEKDISAAYMEAQAKKLPLLFLHNSEISKKAQEMLESGAFDNLTIKKIENGP